MDDVITSKFDPYYYIRCAGVLFIYVLAATGFIKVAIYRPDPAYPRNLVITLILAVALLCIYIYIWLPTFKRVTVTPAGIIVKYHITNKQLNVKYADVKSVGTYRANRDNQGVRKGISYQTLVIELNNGQTFSFTGAQFINYNELKSAIYRYNVA